MTAPHKWTACRSSIVHIDDERQSNSAWMVRLSRKNSDRFERDAEATTPGTSTEVVVRQARRASFRVPTRPETQTGALPELPCLAAQGSVRGPSERDLKDRQAALLAAPKAAVVPGIEGCIEGPRREAPPRSPARHRAATL